jgi:hypothetical protein
MSAQRLFQPDACEYGSHTRSDFTDSELGVDEKPEVKRWPRGLFEALGATGIAGLWARPFGSLQRKSALTVRSGGQGSSTVHTDHAQVASAGEASGESESGRPDLTALTTNPSSQEPVDALPCSWSVVRLGLPYSGKADCSFQVLGLRLLSLGNIVCLLSNPLINVCSIVNAHWTAQTILSHWSGLVVYISWLLLGLLYLSFYFSLFKLVSTPEAVTALLESTHPRRGRALGRKFLFAAAAGAAGGLFIVLYWTPYVALRTVVAQSNATVVLGDATVTVTYLWAVGQFPSYTTPLLVCAVLHEVVAVHRRRLRALVPGLSLDRESMGTWSLNGGDDGGMDRLSMEHYPVVMSPESVIPDLKDAIRDVERTSAAMSTPLATTVVLAQLYIFASIVGTGLALTDPKKGQAGTKEWYFVMYNCFSVGFIGAVCSLIAWDLSSFHASFVDLREILVMKLSGDESRDRPTVVVVKFLQLADSFVGFRIIGIRITRQAYYLSKYASMVAIGANLLTYKLQDSGGTPQAAH